MKQECSLLVIVELSDGSMVVHVIIVFGLYMLKCFHNKKDFFPK